MSNFNSVLSYVDKKKPLESEVTAHLSLDQKRHKLSEPHGSRIPAYMFIDFEEACLSTKQFQLLQDDVL